MQWVTVSRAVNVLLRLGAACEGKIIFDVFPRCLTTYSMQEFHRSGPSMSPEKRQRVPSVEARHFAGPRLYMYVCASAVHVCAGLDAR